MLQNMPMATIMAIMTTMTTTLATTIATTMPVTMATTMGMVVTATEDDPTVAWEIIGRAHSLACSSKCLRYDYGSGYRNGGYSRSNPNIAKVILSSSHILHFMTLLPV